MTLDWEPVEGAVGYLVHRSADAGGPFEPVDHGGNDVLAVPHPPYVDTTGERGPDHWYAVAALSEVDPGRPAVRPGRRGVGRAAATPRCGSTSTRAGRRPPRPAVAADDRLRAPEPDAVRGPGRRPDRSAPELTEALRRMHDELGVETVRAHAHPVRRPRRLPRGRRRAGARLHAASTGSTTRCSSSGLRPVVELSYMPHDLGARPDADRVRLRRRSSPRRGTGTGGPTWSRA